MSKPMCLKCKTNRLILGRDMEIVCVWCGARFSLDEFALLYPADEDVVQSSEQPKKDG